MRRNSEEERDGRTSPPTVANYNPFEDTGASPATTGSNPDERGTSTPTPKCHKWLEEIETDVLRTCPGDETPGEDAIDEFNAAISQQSSTTAERDGSGGDKPDGTRVRFSIASALLGSGGAVVEGSAGVVSGEDGDGVNEKRNLTISGGGTRDKLRRVLRAFAVYNRRVSYCQVCTAVSRLLVILGGRVWERLQCCWFVPRPRTLPTFWLTSYCCFALHFTGHELRGTGVAGSLWRE